MKKIILAVLIISLTTFLALEFAYKSDDTEINDVEIEVNEVSPINETDVYTPKYTLDELNLLAKIIWAEAGSDWLTDEHQRAVASVVINRVNDNRFPDTIKDVIYQEGQYGCVYNGMINQNPNQRAYDNAKYVLENGSVIPEDIVWQSTKPQGEGVWRVIQGHYFCY